MIDLILAVIEAQLTPIEREAFIDHTILGRPQADIARDNGCSRGNICNALIRARRRLCETEYANQLRWAA